MKEILAVDGGYTIALSIDGKPYAAYKLTLDKGKINGKEPPARYINLPLPTTIAADESRTTLWLCGNLQGNEKQAVLRQWVSFNGSVSSFRLEWLRVATPLTAWDGRATDTEPVLNGLTLAKALKRPERFWASRSTC